VKVTAIIPARYESSRLPGKALLKIGDKTMIRHVYERTSAASLVQETVVATDNERILKEIESFGGWAVMTSPEHPTGTDRIAEVAAGLDAEIVVNVQGDEPLIEPEMVDQVARPLIEDPTVLMGSLKSRIKTYRELFDLGLNKVVVDNDDFALYFSHTPIPFCREEWTFDRWAELAASDAPPPGDYYGHVGIYSFRRDFLLHFASLPQTHLEDMEKLEQLRAMEHGYRIKVVTTEFEALGVDTPEDLERIRAIYAERGS